MNELSSTITQVDSKLTRVESKVNPFDSTIVQMHSKVNELNPFNSAVGQLRVDVGTLKNRTGAWDSLIVSEFPPLFEEFRAKRFNLLWRGSCDGFTAREFRRCDGRANTLTLISDINGNVFGGFTPVEWESPASWKWKVNNSLRSFLFTLRNPHGVPPRKFALRAEERQKAIYCDATCCAVFGTGCDMYVYDNCSANRNSRTCTATHWGDRVYANDTTFGDFLTGTEKFTVKEIEVFEIAG
jgi:hypothetical protein